MIIILAWIMINWVMYRVSEFMRSIGTIQSIRKNYLIISIFIYNQPPMFGQVITIKTIKFLWFMQVASNAKKGQNLKNIVSSTKI